MGTLPVGLKIFLVIMAVYALLMVALVIRHAWKHMVKGEPVEPSRYDDMPPL